MKKFFITLSFLVLGSQFSEASEFFNSKSEKNNKIKWAKKIGKKKILYSNGDIKIGGHRNWRNNNPGNLEYGRFAKENGAIGTDGRFAIFPNMNKGFEAQAKLLVGKSYKHKSIKKAILKYAPSFENNSRKYISVITKKLGIKSNTLMKHLSKKQVVKMVKVMSSYEGMKKGIKISKNKSKKKSSRKS